MTNLPRRKWPSRFTRPLVAALPILVAACGGGFRATQVSPDEIPALEAQLQQQPSNGQVLLRYAAALFSANRCDTASVVARRGMAIRPKDALGPLVLGQCLEQSGEYAAAIQVYDAFAAANPDERGIGAVQSRLLFARRAEATEFARNALAREQDLTPQPPNAGAVAVLPVTIVGDSTYQPLSRGLAQMLTSDLALLNRFILVERMQLNALLEELDLTQGDRVDPATAARVGMLTQAGRMVSGLASIPPEGDVRLETAIVLSTGEVTTPSAATGRLRDLLRLEKQLVVDVASQLGYALSRAEREAILENGTQDLTAFLAYSNALVYEDAGDYGSAAVYYQSAVQSDPNFQAARTGFRTATAAPQVSASTAGQVTTVASVEVARTTGDIQEPRTAEISASVGDMAPTLSEQTNVGVSPDQQRTGQRGGEVATVTTPATTTPTASPPTTTTNAGTTQTVTGTIRIVFRIP